MVARLRFLALTDDEYAPVAAVRDLAGFFGFFRPSMRDVLWAEAKEFLGEG